MKLEEVPLSEEEKRHWDKKDRRKYKFSENDISAQVELILERDSLNRPSSWVVRLMEISVEGVSSPIENLRLTFSKKGKLLVCNYADKQNKEKRYESVGRRCVDSIHEDIAYRIMNALKTHDDFAWCTEVFVEHYSRRSPKRQQVASQRP